MKQLSYIRYTKRRSEEEKKIWDCSNENYEQNDNLF